jgi:glycerol-3-phosphate dehydrogenase
MARIIRDPKKATGTDYDLIIIGGGIYGAMLSLEASQRGLKSLLLERDDFGEHTSYNSLRIVHGGLRYLQKLDLRRFNESVQERRWFLKTFPGLVKPLPCLMPLYGKGMKRPGIFRVALLINDFLSRKRNADIQTEQLLDAGGVISSREVQQLFPMVDSQGLAGGAIWHDACMPDSQRILMQVLLWASELDATQLNYVEAADLLVEGGTVRGVQAVDKTTGDKLQYNAPVVINAAGPWSGEIAKKFHRDEESLFIPSLAWNVLIDRKALSSHALAVTPRKPGSRTYFLVPWKGRIMAGTGHAPLDKVVKYPHPSEKQLDDFISDINHAIPGLHVTGKDIAHVYCGLLPAAERGSTELSVREVILDHTRNGGPAGFYSVSGVKLTTSRLVAEKTLTQIFPEQGKKVKKMAAMTQPQPLGIFDFDWLPQDNDNEWKGQLKSIITNEAVQYVDDLLIRRTSLAENKDRAGEIFPFICDLFRLNDIDCKKELEKFIDKSKRGKV